MYGRFCAHNNGTNEAHNPTQLCSDCHTHPNGFEAACTDCHGTTAANYYPDSGAQNGTVWPNPCAARNRDALWRVHHGEPTKADMMLISRMAVSYGQLLAHPWGTEAAVRKLRALRRLVKGTPT